MGGDVSLQGEVRRASQHGKPDLDGDSMLGDDWIQESVLQLEFNLRILLEEGV